MTRNKSDSFLNLMHKSLKFVIFTRRRSINVLQRGRDSITVANNPFRDFMESQIKFNRLTCCEIRESIRDFPFLTTSFHRPDVTNKQADTKEIIVYRLATLRSPF